ncbi:MAG: hypothetical protein WBQ76_14530 [Candidatus Korobacteraceae bacterium]
MKTIAIKELQKIPYLKLDDLRGRTVKLMPFWDGERWHLWFALPEGLVEGQIIDTLEGDYVAASPARSTDLLIPFVELMWQRASWPEVCPLISAIIADFHNMGTSVAKLHHFFNSRLTLLPGAARRFACTELEYLVILARTVFDLLQETISLLWKNRRVRLLDEDSEKRRRQRTLPETFSRILLRDKKVLRSAAEIEHDFALPLTLAEEYARQGPFFAEVRESRDKVVHAGSELGLIFDTERGFCVNPKSRPFNYYSGWNVGHYYNENLVSLLPWVGYLVLQTIDACNRLMAAFCSIIQMPPELAPGLHVFVRGPCNDALLEALNLEGGSSPWWGDAVPES